MAFILKRPSWYLPESAATAEKVYQNRRTFLKAMGFSGLIAGGLACGDSSPISAQETNTAAPGSPLPDYVRHADYSDPGRPLTDQSYVETFNNFFEFSSTKDAPAQLAKGFNLDPYTLEVDGLVERPGKLSVEDIEKLGYEERVYRFRCVEAWAMTVPWLGVPLAKLIKHVGPKPEAKYVRFECFMDPEKAPGQLDRNYSWPYTEGLRVDEALNEVAFIATGVYGKRLLPQSGTPLRIITPWKYGYKGPKSVVRMSFVTEQPDSFWYEAIPSEYKFYSNVDPTVSHPRWSQASERLLGDNRERVPTVWYNGYGEQVAELYADMPRVLS